MQEEFNPDSVRPPRGGRRHSSGGRNTIGVNLERIRFVIGIGNPDERYEQTYHSVGLLAVKYLAPGEFQTPGARRFSYAKAGDVVYALSETPMNASGDAVREFLAYFKGAPDALLLVHDDSDIDLGAYKFSFGRGSAGHAGVESVITALGTNKFWRLRIGIRGGEEERKAGDFVLSRIASEHEAALENVFAAIRRTLQGVGT